MPDRNPTVLRSLPSRQKPRNTYFKALTQTLRISDRTIVLKKTQAGVYGTSTLFHVALPGFVFTIHIDFLDLAISDALHLNHMCKMRSVVNISRLNELN